MSLTIADLFGTPKSLAVTILADKPPLNITYFPEFMTESFEAACAAAGSGATPAKSLADLAATVLHGWDLADVAYSRDALKVVPTLIVSNIITAILEDARPNSTSGDNSAAG